MTPYILAYLGANLLRTYVIFRFFSMFYDRKDIDNKIEACSYTGFFIANCLVYLIFDSPNLNLACNLILCFGLTYNYKSSLKIKIISNLLLYALSIVAECFTLVLSKTIFTDKEYDFTYMTMIISVLLMYLIVLVAEKAFDFKQQIETSIFHGVAIFLLPIGSIYICAILTTEEYRESLLHISLAMVVVLGMNILIFYLYDSIQVSYKVKAENKLAEQQKEFYFKQMKLLEESQTETKKLRHDMKNHLLSLHILLDKEEESKGNKYIEKMLTVLDSPKVFADSGNLIVDSLLNYKLGEARLKGIQIDIKLAFPKDLEITDFDLSIIFGNLLDNAIEAAEKYPFERRLWLKSEIKLGSLFISIKNTFDGRIEMNKGIPVSNKKETGHGYGIRNVREAIEKYNGTMKISCDEKIFSVEAFVPETRKDLIKIQEK